MSARRPVFLRARAGRACGAALAAFGTLAVACAPGVGSVTGGTAVTFTLAPRAGTVPSAVHDVQAVRGHIAQVWVTPCADDASGAASETPGALSAVLGRHMRRALRAVPLYSAPAAAAHAVDTPRQATLNATVALAGADVPDAPVTLHVLSPRAGAYCEVGVRLSSAGAATLSMDADGQDTAESTAAADIVLRGTPAAPLFTLSRAAPAVQVTWTPALDALHTVDPWDADRSAARTAALSVLAALSRGGLALGE